MLYFFQKIKIVSDNFLDKQAGNGDNLLVNVGNEITKIFTLDTAGLDEANTYWYAKIYQRSRICITCY